MLGEALSGPVLAPGDPGYDAVRRVHNGLIDRHPAVIARCVHTADVVDAVSFGRSEGLEISVRGGGHNVAGRAVTDGGLMIDLSLMKGIHVDPVRSTVRAQAGVTVGELDRATGAFGLATPSGVVSTTGIAGLTLGGGIGWLMGKYGMAVDNLLSAEVVLASGEVVTASEDGDRDLFWALRGGGGNFGVVTSFEFRTHPVASVLGGPVLHPLAAASQLFSFYREFAADLPDELSTQAVLCTHRTDRARSCAGSRSATRATTPIGPRPTAGIAWARETFDALAPHMADRSYTNHLPADDDDRVRQAYCPNYERLAALKRRYDPDNLFRLNHNIRPPHGLMTAPPHPRALS